VSNDDERDTMNTGDRPGDKRGDSGLGRKDEVGPLFTNESMCVKKIPKKVSRFP
jgi:hypothetical protein